MVPDFGGAPQDESPSAAVRRRPRRKETRKDRIDAKALSNDDSDIRAFRNERRLEISSAIERGS